MKLAAASPVLMEIAAVVPMEIAGDSPRQVKVKVKLASANSIKVKLSPTSPILMEIAAAVPMKLEGSSPVLVKVAGSILVKLAPASLLPPSACPKPGPASHVDTRLELKVV